MTYFFSCLPSAFCGARRRVYHKGERKNQQSIEGTVTMVHDSSSPVSIASSSLFKKMLCSLPSKFPSTGRSQRRRISVLPSVASSAYSTCCFGQSSSPLIACSETEDRTTETPMLRNRPADEPGACQLSPALQATPCSPNKHKTSRTTFPSETISSLCSKSSRQPNVAQKSDVYTGEFHGLWHTTPAGFPKSNSQLPNLPLQHNSGEIRGPRRNASAGCLSMPCLFPHEDNEMAISGFMGWEQNEAGWCTRRRNVALHRQTIPKLGNRRPPNTKEMIGPAPAIPVEDSERLIFIGIPNTVTGADSSAPGIGDTAVQRVPQAPVDAEKATICLDRFFFRRQTRKGRLKTIVRLGNHLNDNEGNGKQEVSPSPLSDEEIGDELFNMGEGLQVGDEDLLFLSDMTTYIDCLVSDG